MPDLQSLDKLKQRLSEEAKLNVEIVSPHRVMAKWKAACHCKRPEVVNEGLV